MEEIFALARMSHSVADLLELKIIGVDEVFKYYTFTSF